MGTGDYHQLDIVHSLLLVMRDNNLLDMRDNQLDIHYNLLAMLDNLFKLLF